ncbi:hypothetical protein [Streptomyces sp. GQFP]|uniref:hypothetical protein n=1 Tax=Streptomyces sp. GQFP TaxID=2907545 RepID=UPI001F43F5AD|nr:hypothetical protein [Streptomyces sp. GQFP]UIX32137.1 hypothetical protein LUX31_19990 [Streptomyces sp. GQFP]
MYDQTRAQQSSDQPPGRSQRRTSGPEPLLGANERDEIVRRLGRAINHFADTPREALEEAEGAYDDAVAQLVNALAERRRLLHEGWQGHDPETQSDELRLSLRQYREITQRLLHL